MMIFIVGGKGLTGSAIANYAKENNLEFNIIQRENKDEFFGKTCDILIFANGNAIKYKANQDPKFDFNASVSSVTEYVHSINYKMFVHLSTVDVYDQKSSACTTKEDTKINTDNLEPYGYHKYLAEEYVKHFCTNYIIFRLPSLVGKGLRKNPAYDFIHKHKVMISPDSELNFIHTEFMAKSIFKILKLGICNEIINLASRNSIRIKNMKDITGYDVEYEQNSSNKIQNYQINTEKIQQFMQLTSSEEAIEAYLQNI